MVFIMILRIFRWANRSLIMALLMMLVEAAATLKTTMHVFLVYVLYEAEFFCIELFELG